MRIRVVVFGSVKEKAAVLSLFRNKLLCGLGKSWSTIPDACKAERSRTLAHRQISFLEFELHITDCSSRKDKGEWLLWRMGINYEDIITLHNEFLDANIRFLLFARVPFTWAPNSNTIEHGKVTVIPFIECCCMMNDIMDNHKARVRTLHKSVWA